MADFDDHSLDAFLKKNAPAVPAAPPWEKARIWRAIEAQEGRAFFSWRAFFLQPAFRLAAVPALVAVLVAGVALGKKRARDAHVERVLAAALAYQVESLEDDGLF